MVSVSFGAQRLASLLLPAACCRCRTLAWNYVLTFIEFYLIPQTIRQCTCCLCSPSLYTWLGRIQCMCAGQVCSYIWTVDPSQRCRLFASPPFHSVRNQKCVSRNQAALQTMCNGFLDSFFMVHSDVVFQIKCDTQFYDYFCGEDFESSR